ncbi:MAG: phage tail tube protein [Bacteroidales bacterium]
MSSNAISGVGAKFYRWDTSSSVGEWKEQAEVNSITFDGFSRDTIDVTDLKTASTNNGYRSKIAGLRDAGTFSFNMNYTRDQYEKMLNDFETDSNQIYLVVLPDEDETYLEFEGLITDLPLDIPLEDRINSDITVAIDGNVDIGSGGQSGAESGGF